jgi:pyruvate formate lyase activating enzyme
MASITGTVFNTQGYSINDGPGIRTTVFLSGCPLRCRWCQNPESSTAAPKLLFLSEKCTGCRKCIASCPAGAILHVDGRIANNRKKRTICGTCVAGCPAKAREISGERMTAVVERVI